MPKVSNLLGSEYFNFILQGVFAANTGACFSASFSLGEALTVKFETVYLGTLAATVMPGRKVKLLDYFRSLGCNGFEVQVA